MRRPSKDVAVVVPLSLSPELHPDEHISLRHLLHHLAPYDKFMIAPRSVPFSYPGFKVRQVDDGYFGSQKAHAKLLLSPWFYEAFRDYRYVLIHHLDAVVFSDQLPEWCESGLDFIAPPLVPSERHPDAKVAVGVGGFSLRNVASALRVLRSRRLLVEPRAYWRERYAGRPPHVQLVGAGKTLLKHFSRFNGVRQEIEYSLRDVPWFYDDYFFPVYVPEHHPEFRVATVEQALRFGFDDNPWLASELAGGRLPFGAHSWYKWGNRAFWEPHLLT